MKTLVVLCFATLLTTSHSLTIPDTNTATAVTTTEGAPVELLIMEQEEKLDEPDVLSTEGKDQQAEEQDSAKSKRTLEGYLGYGYNGVPGGARLHRQLGVQDKVRAYYTQPPPQHAYRYYTGQVVRGAAPQEEYGHRTQALQVEAQQHRPYSTIALPNNNVEVPQEYYSKAAYHQQQQQLGFQSAPGPLLGSPEPSSVFTAAPQTGGAFYTFPSPQIFPAANPFLTHNFLLPNSGSPGLALLQNPSSPYGPQIIPVIILRIAPGIQHQQQQPTFLQNLLYQQPQRFLEQPQQSPNQEQQQQQHIIYQDNPKTHYIHAPQKIVYKKPVVPTQAPTTVTQKPRKNIIVVNEQPEARSEAPYTQYKYGSYKEKV